MYYKGFKIFCNIHEINPIQKSLSDQIVNAQWGTIEQY